MPIMTILATVLLAACAPPPEVNLLVVDASGRSTDLTWQPSVAAPAVTTVTLLGCESKSMELAVGQAWRLSRDGLVLASSDTVSLAGWSGMIALEVHLNADGTTTVLPPRSVRVPQDAIDPGCGNRG
jgi:hypothetical protein